MRRRIRDEPSEPPVMPQFLAFFEQAAVMPPRHANPEVACRFRRRIHSGASPIAAKMVTWVFYKQARSSFLHCCQDGNVGFLEIPPWSFPHRCQDGNVGFLQAGAIEFPPLLPRW